MITAVDSNVLLDILSASPDFGAASTDALRLCLLEGSLIACAIVWAEVGAAFDNEADARDAFDRLEVAYDTIVRDAALAAGARWRSYRRRGGPRVHVIADFVIGAHALLQADRLLTRDRGFYRRYFKRLTVLDPTAS